MLVRLNEFTWLLDVVLLQQFGTCFVHQVEAISVNLSCVYGFILISFDLDLGFHSRISWELGPLKKAYRAFLALRPLGVRRRQSSLRFGYMTTVIGELTHSNQRIPPKNFRRFQSLPFSRYPS